MKIKQLALLTLSLSVTITAAMSAQVDEKLLQALQPGRRAGVVNQPPSAEKSKTVVPASGDNQDLVQAEAEAVIITPLPRSASPARDVTPAIIVPPPAPVATVGRDGNDWPVVEKPVTNNQGWVQDRSVQPKPARQSILPVVKSVPDSQGPELMDIEELDSVSHAMAVGAPDTGGEPQRIISAQNPKPVVQEPIAIVESVPEIKPLAAVPENKMVAAPQKPDAEQLIFTAILSDTEPMTVSTPIKPDEGKQVTLPTDTRPASVSKTDSTLTKADEKVQQDILNWDASDISSTTPGSRQNIVISSKAQGYANKPPVASEGIPSIEFVKSTVRQALNFSPEIRNAQASFTAAKYDVDEIKGTRWPQVKVGTNSPVSNFGSGTYNSNSSGINDTSGSVSVTTTVYDFGKTGSGIQSAEELSKSTLQMVKLTRNQIAYQVIEGLLTLDKYQKDIKVAKTYEKRMSDLVNMLSQITQTDKGRGSELVQARSKLLQAQTNVQQLESNWRDTQIKMTRLLGREVHLPESLVWDESNISSGSILASLDNHPQIQRAKAEVQASLHKADAIKSSSYPNINWVVSKSTAKDIYGDEQSWYTGINVEWDLFTGGSASASQQAAVQRAQATQMQFETTVLELKYKIRSMIQVRDSAFERAKEYRDLSSETDRVRTMFYEQWYYLGKRSLLDVLTAENEHFNNQISAINNEFDGYTANINIMAESAMLLGWLNMPVY
ncbi:TolC family protein [Jinshanibacter sp. LJY008]|uniref:TolC family protein n=1 Tax=Limnobaculum eriocheiris TaxID=2897391 RepID=A0A9X1SK47_9GAMM|nr:TolC family protein [Limnobaculum eriocheiris]MCD1124879.1 TolC family protein [Limnobaculum eriocheiris]